MDADDRAGRLPGTWRTVRRQKIVSADYYSTLYSYREKGRAGRGRRKVISEEKKRKEENGCPVIDRLAVTFLNRDCDRDQGWEKVANSKLQPCEQEEEP